MAIDDVVTSYVNKEDVKLASYDLFLLRYSKIVDKVDMFLGPFSEVAKFSDAELIKLGGFCSAIIKGIIKVPFVSMYLLRTKDFSALYDWGPKELFSYSVPLGGFIDILRSYEKVTYLHYGLEPFKPIPEHKKRTKTYLNKALPRNVVRGGTQVA